MSKMNKLATVLDEIAEVGKTLITCGEDLMRAAANIRECFATDESSASSSARIVQESEPIPVSSKAYTKEDVRALLANLSQSGFRNEAKALVRKYSNSGSLSDILPEKYAELVAEAEALHG
ncbi:MAG TPA: hypothetical protein GXZ86_01350 [Clostridiales bacterium]|nr:hypothetical protein [Clostridiales bacterium]